MTKRTKKVGVTGKYGTRYGASLRKQVKKMEVIFFFFVFLFLARFAQQKQSGKGSVLANSEMDRSKLANFCPGVTL